MKNIAKLYSSLLNFLVKKEIDDLYIKNYEYINEKVYHNLESSFGELVRNENYSDYSLFQDVLLNDIFLRYSKRETEVLTDDIQKLIESIKEVFLLNKEEHFILIPLPELKLEELIFTEMISIIPRKMSEEEKVTHLSTITGLSIENVKNSLSHTKQSRSPDFMKHAILVFNHTGQTEYIKYNASFIARGIVSLLRAYYYGEIYEVDEYLSNIDILNYYNYETNHHLAILAKDSWRQGHSTISYSTKCSFSADFLHNTEHMEKFTQLIKQLVLTKESPKSIGSLFYGALRTYNKSLDLISDRESQSLGVLLMITTAETILAQENHSNRMKVRVLLPRFVEIPVLLERRTIIDSLEQLYKMRNEYAHAGKEAYFSEIEGEINSYNIAKKSIGKLICMYPELCLDMGTNSWEDYLKEKFNNGIDGFL